MHYHCQARNLFSNERQKRSRSSWKGSRGGVKEGNFIKDILCENKIYFNKRKRIKFSSFLSFFSMHQWRDHRHIQFFSFSGLGIKPTPHECSASTSDLVCDLQYSIIVLYWVTELTFQGLFFFSHRMFFHSLWKF